MLLLEEYIFKSIMIKCGIIHRKVVCGEVTTIILNDQWISFKLEYELVNIEIKRLNVDALVKNRLVRRNVYFVRIGNKIILHFSKQF